FHRDDSVQGNARIRFARRRIRSDLRLALARQCAADLDAAAAHRQGLHAARRCAAQAGHVPGGRGRGERAPESPNRGSGPDRSGSQFRPQVTRRPSPPPPPLPPRPSSLAPPPSPLLPRPSPLTTAPPPAASSARATRSVCPDLLSAP